MKIALLIAGYLRGFHENIDNIKNNIIQNNECDIYMHVTENDLDDKYHNKKYTIDSIRKELNPKMLIISNNFKFSDNKTINNLLNQNYKYYLLVEGGVIRGGNYTWLTKLFRNKVTGNIITASLYENIGSRFQSDVVAEYYDNTKQDLTFYFERENKHWN